MVCAGADGGPKHCATICLYHPVGDRPAALLIVEEFVVKERIVLAQISPKIGPDERS